MKEKLLILGDSFAHTREELPDFSGKAWTKLLEEGNDYRVMNKAIGGSSLYYSYKEFNRLHQEFDKVMLVITQAGRLYCPIIGETDKLNTSSSHHTGTFWIDQNKDRIKKQQPHNLAAIKQLDAIRDYFLYILDWEKDKEMNQLMLDDIKRIRPDTILVPAFQASWTTLPQPISWLDQISDMEMKHYNITHDDLNKKDGHADCRKCHMSERNNQILYEKSLKWLKGHPVEFDISEFEKPNEPREKYFTMRKEWEMRLGK
jgi:hypothetical protein